MAIFRMWVNPTTVVEGFEVSYRKKKNNFGERKRNLLSRHFFFYLRRRNVQDNKKSINSKFISGPSSYLLDSGIYFGDYLIRSPDKASALGANHTLCSTSFSLASSRWVRLTVSSLSTALSSSVNKSQQVLGNAEN